MIEGPKKVIFDESQELWIKKLDKDIEDLVMQGNKKGGYIPPKVDEKGNYTYASHSRTLPMLRDQTKAV